MVKSGKLLNLGAPITGILPEFLSRNQGDGAIKRTKRVYSVVLTQA